MVDPRETPFGAQPPRFVPACSFLRTKTQFYRPEDQDQAPGMIADSDTLSYWCAKTDDHIGPDRRGCCPDSCQAARVCYDQSPIRI